MQKHLLKKFPTKDIEVVYPWVDLKVFKSKKKQNKLIIPSVPYKIKDFEERGINKILKIIKEKNLKSKIIFRSLESYKYIKKMEIKNSILINDILSDENLSKLMADCKIIPLIYSENSPDMPLSAIEGLASGCAIICSKNLGISDIIRRNKCGIIVKNDSENEIINAITKIFKSKSYNKNARKTAEKYFDKSKNLKKILETQ